MSLRIEKMGIGRMEEYSYYKRVHVFNLFSVLLEYRIMGERDGFKSRMGFLLVSAGCAIGIGNVWKFPYIAGQYGGAVFVLFTWHF